MAVYLYVCVCVCVIWLCVICGLAYLPGCCLWRRERESASLALLNEGGGSEEEDVYSS